jgi:prophage regulatory protein
VGRAPGRALKILPEETISADPRAKLKSAMSEIIEQPERLLTLKAVTEFVPFSRQWLMHLVAKGDFPQPLKLSERRIAFRQSEVQAWLDHQPRAWKRS